MNYISAFNSALLCDIIFIYFTLYIPFLDSKYLIEWYNKYKLQAVIADVLIITIGIIIAEKIYKKYIKKPKKGKNILYFILITLGIQILHDILFYIFFSNVPNHSMFKLFQNYASEIGYKAIIGDSAMIILSCLFYVLFSDKLSNNHNIELSILLIYLVPFLINKN